MPFNSGTYTAPTDSWNPAVSNTTISSADWNTVLSDLCANGLSKCFLRDGSVPMSSTLLLASGTATVPGVAFNAESNTGLYRPASGQLGVAVGGAQIAYFSSGGLNVPTAINFVTSGTLQVSGSAGTAGQILMSGGASALPSWSNNLPALVQNEGSLGSGTTTIDWSAGDIIEITLTGSALTLAFSNTPAAGFSQTITILFTQDATGGRTLPTFSSTIRWDSGATPVLTTTANKTDMIQIMAVNVGGTTTFYGSQIYGNG